MDCLNNDNLPADIDEQENISCYANAMKDLGITSKIHSILSRTANDRSIVSSEISPDYESNSMKLTSSDETTNRGSHADHSLYPKVSLMCI